jgi:type IV secretory pathway TraG/TraD family ATPase VirD4
MKRLGIVAAVLAGIVALYFVFTSDYPLRALIVLLALAAWIALTWASSKIKTPEPPQKEPPPLSDNYGAADFAPQQTSIAAGLSDFGGVFFGKSSSPPPSSDAGVPVCSTPENHTLIVARTRTGKGTRIIVPTLLRSMHSSCIVIDPKGENAAITARARSAKHRIQIINPWGELSGTFAKLGFPTATYNPLDILDANDPNATSIAQALAAAICSVEGGKDAFWKGSAGDLLAAVFLYLAYWPGEKKTLARARDITSMNRGRFTKEVLSNMVATDAFDGAIRNASDQFVDMATDTYSGIISNLNRCMVFLNDPQIRRATAASSFAMTDLTGLGVDRPTTLYIVAPTKKLATQRMWLRLLVTAATHTFKSDPKGPYRCMFLMDEFANLGFLDEMPTEIAEASGHGIDFTLILQGLSQLKKTYGDSDATIMGNCAFKWFCNLDDLDTQKYVSESLGKKTVRTVSKGATTGISTGFKGSGSEQESESTTYSETQRDLLQPNEVRNLGKNVALLFAPGSLPHYLRPVDYWQLPNAFAMFHEACPKLFWEPPLLYDANPLVPESRGSAFAAPPPPRSPVNPERETPAPTAWRRLVNWISGRKQPPPTTEPQIAKPPSGSNFDPAAYAPKAAQPKPSSNYDPSYYSPQRIAERAEEAAKKASPQAPQKPAEEGSAGKPISNYDPSLYAPKPKPQAPPQEPGKPVAERAEEAVKKASPQAPKKPRPKLPGGELDEDGIFRPFPPKKHDDGGDG